MAQLLFEDIFVVKRKDRHGKKFDKVSRIEAKGEKFDMEMHLDVNTEIYPIEIGEKYFVALSPTLNLDATPGFGYSTPGVKSLADKYEYVMHGTLYKITEFKPEEEKKSKESKQGVSEVSEEKSEELKDSKQAVSEVSEEKSEESEDSKQGVSEVSEEDFERLKVEVYVSFGGLLMMLKGEPSNAAIFKLDQRLFLLMRKL